MMVRLLVLKKARSWTISLLQRSSGHVILGMQLGFRGPGMNSLACRLADLFVFCRSSDYVCNFYYNAYMARVLHPTHVHFSG